MKCKKKKKIVNRPQRVSNPIIEVVNVFRDSTERFCKEIWTVDLPDINLPRTLDSQQHAIQDKIMIMKPRFNNII